MPTFSRFGSRLTTTLTDAAKVPARTSVFSTRPAIQADYWARNGTHPDARLVSSLNEAANQAALYRSKEVFHAIGRLDGSLTFANLSSTSGTRERYRFAFRTGPFAHGLGVIVGMVYPDDAAGVDQNSYGQLDITDGTGSTIASATFVYGASPFGTSLDTPGWQYIKQIMSFVDGLSPDTEYYGTFSDRDYGRLQSACVFELATLSENGGHLAQNITTHSAILDVHRQYPAEISNAIWQKGGSQVLNWTRDNGTLPQVIGVSTPTNLIDLTSTTVSSATPGYTLDMRSKARLSQATGVPVTMKVYAKVSAQTVLTSAGINLVDSSGSTVLSITGTGASAWSTTGAWFSTTGVLPEAVDKYDFQVYSNDIDDFSVYAVSVYEYG